MIYKNIDDANMDTDWMTFLKNYHKDVFFLEITSDFHIILDTIAKNKELLNNIDKVILVSKTEAFFSSMWFEVVRRLKMCGVKERNIFIEDAGDIINPSAREWYHTTTPILTGNQSVYVKKDKILLSLARIPRPFRVVMTSELLERNIIPSEKVLMTCGSSEQQWHRWFNMASDTHKKQFPIQTFGAAYRNEFYEQEKIYENIWARALINLVMESGYNFSNVVVSDNVDYTFLPLCESWDRLFFTEKTEKAFRYHQIPIFVAPAGYVKYLRNLNYDVFDDFIDHSYDDELDPYVRIKLVANEVQKACEYLAYKNVNEYSILIRNFEYRTEQNFLNTEKIRTNYRQQKIQKIKQFLSI